MFGKNKIDDSCDGCVHENVSLEYMDELRESIRVCIKCKRSYKKRYQKEFEDKYVGQ